MTRGNIPALEVILSEQPVVVSPRHLSSQCVTCGQEEEAGECVRCRCLVCEQCQPLHSRGESAECSVLARAAQLGLHLTPEVVIMLRLLTVRNQGGELWAHIDKMMDHVEDRKKDARKWSTVEEKIIHVVQKIWSEDDICDSVLHKLYGIICTNCISLEDMIGLYPVLAMINHSCVANTVYTLNTETNSVILRAKRRLEAGEEITLCYTDLWVGQPHRRIKLSKTWYFDCKCPRCSDVTEFGTNMSALKCSSCSEGLVLPEASHIDSTWSCRFCTNPYDFALVTIDIDQIEEELYSIIDSNSNDAAQLLLMFVSKHSGKLHSKHYLNLLAWRHVIILLSEAKTVTREAANKIIKLGKSIKSTMYPLDTGYSEWLGYLLKMINKAQLQLLKMNYQEKRINKNVFAEESEAVWKTMKEVEMCENLSAVTQR